MTFINSVKKKTVTAHWEDLAVSEPGSSALHLVWESVMFPDRTTLMKMAAVALLLLSLLFFGLLHNIVVL